MQWRIGLTGLNPLSILFKIYAIKFELSVKSFYIIIVKQNKYFAVL